jgi:hypothetical protein
LGERYSYGKRRVGRGGSVGNLDDRQRSIDYHATIRSSCPRGFDTTTGDFLVRGRDIRRIEQDHVHLVMKSLETTQQTALNTVQKNLQEHEAKSIQRSETYIVMLCSEFARQECVDIDISGDQMRIEVLAFQQLAKIRDNTTAP